MTEEKPKIVIEYDSGNYSNEQIAGLEAELSKYFALEKRKVSRFSTEPPSYLVFLLVSLPVLYFSKGFFTTFGADLAHELSREVIEGYRNLKQRIVKIITRPISKDIPTVIFQIPILEDRRSLLDPAIKGVIETKDEEGLSECFDHIEGLCRKAKTAKKQIGTDAEISRIEFRYNARSKDWEPQLCELKGHTQLLYKSGKWQRIQ
ncbi:MAG: hypothetical protein WCE90_03700 [Candidatus Zixiibacteriota bacterium]